jgi:hypothetical protein
MQTTRSNPDMVRVAFFVDKTRWAGGFPQRKEQEGVAGIGSGRLLGLGEGFPR